MRKKHSHVVVVFSSEDDNDGDIRTNRPSTTTKSKSRKVFRQRNSRRPEESCGLVEEDFNLFTKDIYEDLDLSNVTYVGKKRKQQLCLDCGDVKDLWVDKYKPRCLAELAVHKKKFYVTGWRSKYMVGRAVQDVKGPAGVGKSATVHVVVSHIGAELCEWQTPTPTLWQEYNYNANSGISYISKLDEFETFVEKIRKYPSISSSSRECSKKNIVMLIDDLPVTNGRAADGRLRHCLHSLVISSQCPTVILITESSKTQSGEELLLLLEKAGASKLAFNPITANSIKKTLVRICREEMCSVTPEWIDHIAKGSGGDIRHAITALQYLCLRPNLLVSLPLSIPISCSSKGEPGVVTSVQSFEGLDEKFFSLSMGRDETLSLFHALGKFLHNKRDTEQPADLGQGYFQLQEMFMRYPLKMDAPEKILSQAYAEASSVADFLHENVLDFISDEAVDDAVTIASYLSDSDCLSATLTIRGSSGSSSILSRHDSKNVSQQVAASVAVRGVLFGNSHPLPSRWHSIRSPKLWQIKQLSFIKKNEILSKWCEAQCCFSICGFSVMTTEYQYALQLLGSKVSSLSAHTQNSQIYKPEQQDIRMGEQPDWMATDESTTQVGTSSIRQASIYDLDIHISGESEEDEIEEW
ncbi:cell cycle checkpoint protein RAD17 isoform X3 [Amborella trichopoda]|uniref:cell cycle checkpoint protein RAD17 isoform X3 n=1 Tax=Amborella trichopoda TaxID=13333 RepID=UPI0009BF3A8F|nr:cell cycle checkpoint protein RAD17 isoform X3 [Amborella trichopoda]|eukprot:XP_020530752.1 cell cycle checkpoint protein RAD17 isoform X3 [Amborella trichopoda]